MTCDIIPENELLEKLNLDPYYGCDGPGLYGL